MVDRPIEQANIMLGVPGITTKDDRRTTLGVLSAILGGGMSSRLFQEVREKRGLAYSVYSFGSSYSDAGVFGLFAGTSPSKAAEVSEIMLAELHKLAEHGVTAAEMKRASGQLAGSSALALEDTDTRMSRLGRSEISLGEFYDYDASMALLDAVARLQPGVLNDEGSHQFDSFNPALDGLLDCPHYTRPEQWEGRSVPTELLSGHHAQIERWRRAQQLTLSQAKRPELIEQARAAGRLSALDEAVLKGQKTL